MAEIKKKSWEEIVAESNGTRIFLPDGFKGAAKDWSTMRDEYNKSIKVMAEKELTLQVALQNLFLEVRRYLSKNGYEDIWTKDTGFNTEALKEGKFIVEIVDGRKNQLPGA